MRCHIAIGIVAVLALSALADPLDSAGTIVESGDSDSAASLEITEVPDTSAVETLGAPAPTSPSQPPPIIMPAPSSRNIAALKYTPAQEIRLHTRTAVTGCAFFFVGLGVEWGVLFPWSLQMAHRAQDLQKRIDAYEDNGSSDYLEEERINSDISDLLGESVGLLLAGIPVNLSKTLGASYACAGASRAYGAYQARVDPGTPDIRVWKPYMAGWVLTACGGVLGALGFLWSLGGEPAPAQLGYISSALSIGRDVTWATASIMSVIYAADKREITSRGVSLAPYGPNGLALNVRF